MSASKCCSCPYDNTGGLRSRTRHEFVETCGEGGRSSSGSVVRWYLVDVQSLSAQVVLCSLMIWVEDSGCSTV